RGGGGARAGGAAAAGARGRAPPRGGAGGGGGRPPGLDPRALRARQAETVLTPHAGEAAALLGVAREVVEAGRLAAVRELAGRYGATALLKGSTTLVASAGARTVRVNPTGTAWLATAGSGDVLAGFAGSLLAAGLSGADAASTAAYLHGLAGRIAADGGPLLAHDVAAALPSAWRDVGAGRAAG
ncbi:NAD(P)H-hydrate dehydratase, partial [Streptomyces sp. NPDC059431]|uniref:ADP-dependent NAD(P)H-hydrate dehydratase n=1 Tax=Streptomyces sp. NPDC059431 TaxID=3346828 RepID=UPI0036C7314B